MLCNVTNLWTLQGQKYVASHATSRSNLLFWGSLFLFWSCAVIFPESDDEGSSTSGSVHTDLSESDGDSDAETSSQVCFLTHVGIRIYIITSNQINHKTTFISLVIRNLLYFLPKSHATPCRYYNMGNCQDGDRCVYMHVCQYALKGNCRYGSNCKLNHRTDGKGSSSASKGASNQSSKGEEEGERLWGDVFTVHSPWNSFIYLVHMVCCKVFVCSKTKQFLVSLK